MSNLFYLFILGTLWLTPPVADGEAVTLTVQLRATDGAPLGGKAVILERLPDAAAEGPLCQTDPEGLCAWSVAPGLYQVRFPAYTLDDLSALALAEGGLSGLGITIGETAIRYAFTVQDDGHVYFDATPDAAAPTPRLPQAEAVVGDAPATPIHPVLSGTVAPNPPVRAWVWWLGGGVMLGCVSWVGWHWGQGRFSTPRAPGR